MSKLIKIGTTLSIILFSSASAAWDLVSESPFTIQANDTTYILPIQFVCGYDGKLRAYQNDEEVTDKIISGDTLKVINDLYSIFYGNHSSIEVNDYRYIVYDVDKVEYYMRHCDG
ncbi:hypothetical protein [Thorsellia anophelis]|uniref:Uncharacterized protein n=1 Tax=Thorsellia anophelis DSM 18579 TaxID=1123402 RepID=A0A1I0F9L3_9GAMM|nr:hypothetical protein [Thorsellia anophelis]SET54190.1 hypothetical protein SAMN02583745_02675 [Thorsellia anophelis DSM 18579]